jgi:NAD(P)-dependent dehydrogenase (short-subunit alcohol dehydrogenase family)
MAFRGKVALVTGAASGMGQISAWRLAEAGALVACLDQDDAKLPTTTARNPDRLKPYVCDVSDANRVTETVRAIERDLGPIDRVTHAAGIMPAGHVLDMPIESIIRLMRVNYEGTVYVTRATLPQMKERRSGDLILFGSLAGHVLLTHLGAYSASKSAVNTLAEVMIHENRGSGVRIMLVCPPMANTPLIQQAVNTSNPRTIQIGIEQKRMADPVVIVEEIEKGIERGEEILYPLTEAKVLLRLRRFFPGLLWTIMHKAENS